MVPDKNAREKTLLAYAMKKYDGNEQKAYSWLRGWRTVGGKQ